MNTLRYSISLLGSLLTVYPCQATEGNMELLRQAKEDVEHYARLKVLQGMVEGSCVGDAWKQVCFIDSTKEACYNDMPWLPIVEPNNPRGNTRRPSIVHETR